jgi:hypothetical protein
VTYSTHGYPVCARPRDCLHRHQAPLPEREEERSPEGAAAEPELWSRGMWVTRMGPRVEHGGPRPEALQLALAGAGVRFG